MTIRAEIGTALVQQLIDDGVAHGAVYNTRLYGASEDDYPVVYVTILNDTVDYSQSAGSAGLIKQMRILDVEIVIKAFGNSGELVSDTLDIVATEIETSIYNNKSLGLGLRDNRYQGTEYAYNTDSAEPRGSATMSFLIMYQIKEPDASALV